MTPPKRRRTHVRASERPPPTPALEDRVAALEAAVLGLTRSIANLKVLKDSGQGLPTLPAGSGHALSIARQKAGWANHQLAEAIGVTKSMLSLWECEKHAIPRWRAETITSIFTTAGAEPPAWNDPPAWTDDTTTKQEE